MIISYRYTAINGVKYEYGVRETHLDAPQGAVRKTCSRTNTENAYIKCPSWTNERFLSARVSACTRAYVFRVTRLRYFQEYTRQGKIW
jgi:hypothetical protein